MIIHIVSAHGAQKSSRLTTYQSWKTQIYKIRVKIFQLNENLIYETLRARQILNENYL